SADRSRAAWISRMAASPRLTIAMRLNNGEASGYLHAKGDARTPSDAFTHVYPARSRAAGPVLGGTHSRAAVCANPTKAQKPPPAPLPAQGTGCERHLSDIQLHALGRAAYDSADG